MYLRILTFFILIIFVAPKSGDAQNGTDELIVTFNKGEYSIREILSKYIQIESVSGHEKNAGEFLKQLCEENGLHIKQMGNEDGNYNFSASVFPLTKRLPNIIFLIHIDVVPAGDLSKWTYPPYSGMITDTEIWGRGSWDNKGAAIMQLFSIIEIARKYENVQIPYNITLLAVSCEETQCDGGVKYVVQNYLDDLNPVVVIGEGPPSIKGLVRSRPETVVFGISVAHKRAFWVSLELEIKTSGHGAVTPPEYANKEMVAALDRLLKKKQKLIFNDFNVSIFKQFAKLEKGIPSLVFKHPKLFKVFIAPQIRKEIELHALCTNTITLTSINSNNEVVNVIPNKVTALLDCMLLPLESSEEFLKYLRKRLNNDDIKISILNEMPVMPPSDDKNKFFITLKKAILSNYPNSIVASVFMPFFNDSGIFRSKGINAFNTIPVMIDFEYLDHIHNYNERVPIRILIQGQKTYFDFIEGCLE